MAAAVEFLPGQADLVAARLDHGAVAQLGGIFGRRGTPVGHGHDAAGIEEAAAVGAVDAMQPERLAGERAALRRR